MEKQDMIKSLRKVSRDACRSNSCVHGYEALLFANSVPAIASVWRKYLEEFVGTRYVDVVRKKMVSYYPTLRDDFNAVGIYYNECPKDADYNTIVLACDSDTAIDVYADARVYIIGKAHVVAHGRANVVCNQSEGSAELLDCSSGQFKEGKAVARNRSTLVSMADCECYDGASVTISKGTITDYGHVSIVAAGDAVVNSFTSRKISLYGNAKLNIR